VASCLLCLPSKDTWNVCKLFATQVAIRNPYLVKFVAPDEVCCTPVGSSEEVEEETVVPQKQRRKKGESGSEEEDAESASESEEESRHREKTQKRMNKGKEKVRLRHHPIRGTLQARTLACSLQEASAPGTKEG
jgi:hypothetical protein